MIVHCPLLLINNSHCLETNCRKDCAWFDVRTERCIVFSIANWLEGINENTTNVIGAMISSQLDNLPSFDIRFVESLNCWEATAILPGDTCRYTMTGPNEETARARLSLALTRRSIELKNEKRKRKKK